MRRVGIAVAKEAGIATVLLLEDVHFIGGRAIMGEEGSGEIGGGLAAEDAETFSSFFAQICHDGEVKLRVRLEVEESKGLTRIEKKEKMGGDKWRTTDHIEVVLYRG